MKRTHLIAGALLCLVLPGGPIACAQVSLPNVQLPNLPQVGGVLDDTLNRTTDSIDTHVLRTLRQTRVRALIRNNRGAIEADPQGAPILSGELVAFAPSEAALARAQAVGFSIAREVRLDALDVTVIVLRSPEGISTRRALKELRSADPEGSYDYNHLYLESGVVGATEQPSRPAEARMPTADSASTGSAVRIGLIDSGVDAIHPVFATTTIVQEGCNGKPVADAHGTAVASLIAGDSEQFRGAATHATLYAADVYCGLPTGGSIDAIASALGWMAREQVPVVNISLVGPPNTLLESVTRLMVARGHLLVAAVGNDGPAAKPLYPAAYPGVIGVTGVDAKQRVLLEACRGPQVDFAAPGADMVAAKQGGTFSEVRGTSFAAPIVSALLASRLSTTDGAAAAEAARTLAASATDLGSHGRDNTYGDGLVGASLRPQFAASGRTSQTRISKVKSFQCAQEEIVSARRSPGEGSGLSAAVNRENHMKIHRNLAAAAVALALTLAQPANADLLGGSANGALSGTLSSGMVDIGGMAGGSAAGSIGAQTDAIGRVGQRTRDVGGRAKNRTETTGEAARNHAQSAVGEARGTTVGASAQAATTLNTATSAAGSATSDASPSNTDGSDLNAAAGIGQSASINKSLGAGDRTVDATANSSAEEAVGMHRNSDTLDLTSSANSQSATAVKMGRKGEQESAPAPSTNRNGRR